MLDVIVYAVVGLLCVQALWRLPSALRGKKRERFLWGFLAGFCGAWLLRTEFGLYMVNGNPDLTMMLKYVFVVIALCSLARYLSAVERDSGRQSRATWLADRCAVPAAAITIAAMAGVFFFGLKHSKAPVYTDAEFMSQHAGDYNLSVFMSLFFGYHVLVLMLCIYQWGSAMRQAPRSVLRVGLFMVTGGVVLGLVYSISQIVYSVMLSSGEMPTPSEVRTENSLAEALLNSAFLLLISGLFLPFGAERMRTLRAMRTPMCLHVLWRDLVRAVPGKALHPPVRLPGLVGVMWDILGSGSSSQARLQQFVVEIRDAIRDLRRHVPDGLQERARALAAREGYRGEEAEVRAEALWLATAVRAARTHPRRATRAAFTTGAGSDLADEVPWLLRVTASYRTIRPETVDQLLRLTVSEADA